MITALLTTTAVSLAPASPIFLKVNAPVPASCPPVSEAEIVGQFAFLNRAWSTGDPDTVTALFTTDPVLLPTVSNTPRTTPAGVRDYFTSFLRLKPVARIDTSTVEIDCRTASRVGTRTVTLTDPTNGQSRQVRARYSFIYRFEDGAWKIDQLHSSVMPEIGESQP